MSFADRPILPADRIVCVAVGSVSGSLGYNGPRFGLWRGWQSGQIGLGFLHSLRQRTLQPAASLLDIKCAR